MNKIAAKEVAIAFMSVVIVLVVFASSVLYNSIEGPLVAACLILLALVNKDILTHAKDVKIIFFINFLFACSVLSTGLNFYTRQQVSMTEAFSDASSIILTSVIGVIVYAAFRNIIVRRYLRHLILLFAIVLFLYCYYAEEIVGDPYGRVWDIQGRFVIDVGLLFCLLSLCMLSNQETSPKSIFFSIFTNSVAFYIVFIAIQSRAMSIALCLAWLIALFTLRHKLISRFSYIIGMVVIVLGIQSYSNFSEVDMKKFKVFSSLMHAVFEREHSCFNDTSSTSKTKQPSETNASNRLSNSVDTIAPVSGISTNKNGQSSVGGVFDNIAVEEIILNSDYSIRARFQMLVVGFEYAKSAWIFGHGNMVEADIMKNQFNSKHPNLHNQYLSLIISGGLVHLLLGCLFLDAPFIYNNKKDSAINFRNTLPLVAFVFCFLSFESLLQLSGWRNLLIIYGYIIAGVLHEKSILR